MKIEGLLWCGFSGECNKRIPCYILEGTKKGETKDFDEAADGTFLCDILHKYANKNIRVTI